MKYTLKDLLDIPRLRELLDSFDEIHSMPSAIIDIEGNVLTATAWQDICTKFHRVNPETEEKCIESDIHIKAGIEQMMSHVVYRCPMGLVDSATPIIVDGEHLGNVFTGQLFIDPPDETQFIEQARQYGFGEAEYLAAMRKVPYFSEAHLHRNLTFIHRLAQMLAEQGLQHKRLIEAESALRESERRISDVLELNNSILNTSSIGIATYNAAGQCIFANESAAKMVGTSVGGLISQNFHQIESWRISGMYGLACRSLMFGNEQEMAAHLMTSFGKDIWLNVRFSTFESKGEKCLLLFTQDITERKMAEDDLRNTKGRIEAMLSALPDLMFRTDREGYIHECHASSIDLLYVPPSAFLGKKLTDVLPEEASHIIMAGLNEAAARGSCRNAVYSLDRPHGVFWYELSIAAMGDPMQPDTHFIMLARDITTRMHAEKNLKDTLLLNQQIINCVQEGIIVHDRDLHYLVWNPFLEKLTGIPAADVIGKYPLDRFPFLKETGAMDQIEKALAGETVPGAEFYFNVPETGKSGWTFSTAAPLLTESGEIFGVIRTLSDITDHRKIEEQLRQSQKMEALGQLAGGIAHDFNNVLQIIIGYTTLLGIKATDEQKEKLNEIFVASERAAELTSGLLAYSRKQVFKLETIDINNLIVIVEKFLRRVLGEDIALQLHRASEPLLASVDKTHLQQVFVNLASNARDAMSSGGRLSIHLERMVMDNAFVHAHGFGMAGPYALITVSDTGMGIVRDHLHKIFEPFFTTKAEGKGTGLGLSIVYGIISQHRGFITCYSEPGIGTTFNIYLPLVDDAIQSVEPPSKEQITRAGNLTILLVEDDPAVRKVTQSMLKVQGYTVIEAEHGKQALEIFRQHHAAIQLVILDAIMPEMNGVETLVLLQKIVPDVKALFMSGYAPDLICGKMTIPENVVFLNKPVIPARLMEGIRETMENERHSCQN
jgi:PAS domain S-box-containing protein